MADEDLRQRVMDNQRDIAVLKEQMSTIREGLGAIRSLPTDVAKMSNALDRCGDDTSYLKKKIEEREEQRALEAEERRKERKADRKWMIGTILTTGGLIIAAVGFLIDKL